MKRRFKVGQTVYYYLDNGNYTGTIIKCTVTKVTKDLSTGKITYKVSTCDESKLFSMLQWITERDLTDEYLYASKKQIEKEHKDEIAYNLLYKAILSLENTFYDLKAKLEPQKEYNLPAGMTLSIGDSEQSYSKVYINTKDVILDGTISLRDEIDKLKKKVKSIEKKLKSATKKKVDSERKQQETVAETAKEAK